VIYLQNRSPTQALKLKTPEEAFTGIRPQLGHLRVIGCVTYCHIPVVKRTKLAPKALVTILLGYDSTSHAYRCRDPVSRKIIISRDIRFDESSFDTKLLPLTEVLTNDLSIPLSSSISTPIVAPASFPVSDSLPVHSPPSSLPDLSPPSSPTPSSPKLLYLPALPALSVPSLRRSTRIRKQSVKLNDYHVFVTRDDPDLCFLTTTPSAYENLIVTFDQAMRDHGWHDSMRAELGSISNNQTWTLEELPTGIKPINSQWIFRLKPRIDGLPPIKKARLVAMGNQQKDGIDYLETFAPIINWVTIRTIVALVATNQWQIHHMDVRTAFINGNLKETVYMRQPRGFIEIGKEHLFCRLQKSIYGLQQSPHTWYEIIDLELTTFGMLRNQHNANMYHLHQNGATVILMVYVDDLFITGNSDLLVSTVKQFLQHTFSMTDLGLIKRYLGVSFEYLLQGIFLHQQDYAHSILKEFGMLDYRPAKVPMPEGTILLTDMLSPYVDSTYYCKLLGKLIFLTITRANIAYAVNRISSYMAHPQQAHLDAVLHIIRYLQGTLDTGILYHKSLPSQLTGFTDADWGSCLETRRSIGAYIFTLGHGPVTWMSKKQLTVARSSTEAEYRALSDGAQEGIWLSRLLKELNISPCPTFPLNQGSQEITTNLSTPSVLHMHCDNQGAMKLAKNPVFHTHSKHIKIHHHFIWERVSEGEIGLSYINTKSQPTNILTKPLGRVKFETHWTAIGLHSLKALQPKTSP
jgi:hypothetical protein